MNFFVGFSPFMDVIFWKQEIETRSYLWKRFCLVLKISLLCWKWFAGGEQQPHWVVSTVPGVAEKSRGPPGTFWGPHGCHSGDIYTLIHLYIHTFKHLYNYDIQIWRNRQIFPQVFYALVFFLGVIGNTLVIYVVIRFSKMHTVNSLTSS